MAPRTGRPVKTRTTATRASRSSTSKEAEPRSRKPAKKETVKADTSSTQKSKQVLTLVAAEQKDESNSLASAAFITSSPRPSSRRKDLGKRPLRELELPLEPQDNNAEFIATETNDENDIAQLASYNHVSMPTNEPTSDSEMHVDAGHHNQNDNNMQEKRMDDEAMEEILSCETMASTFFNENGMEEGGSGSGSGDTRRQSILQAIFSPAFKLLKKMPYGPLSDYTSNSSSQLQLEDSQMMSVDTMDDVVMASTAYHSELATTTTTTTTTINNNNNTTTTTTNENYTLTSSYTTPLNTEEVIVDGHSTSQQTYTITDEERAMILANTLQSNGQVEEIEEIEEEEEEYTQELEIDEFDPYLFMATVPPVPKEYQARPYALPRKTRSSPPITLVLDLDETLVHCSTSPIGEADLKFPVEFNGMLYEVHGRCRPYYREFLERVALMFEVVIFTASQKSYANRLLDIIDPSRKLIKYRLFRDSCVHVCGNYLKDLSILGRDLSKVVIVDNAPQAFAYQLSNGIPIESWYEDPADKELLNVLQFLETLVGQEDVRPCVEQQFRTHDRIRNAQLQYG